MIKGFRSKALKLLATKGYASKLPISGAAVDRVEAQLTALDVATAADQLDVPGWYFHPLRGRPVRYSVRVTANYRMTFAFDPPDGDDVDLEDYHQGQGGHVMTISLLAGLRPVHPGTILRRDVVPALGVPTVAVAKSLGISRQHLYDIMNAKKPITAATALRLGRYLGNGPDLWINLQARYDLRMAEREMVDELAAITPAERIADAA